MEYRAKKVKPPITRAEHYQVAIIERLDRVVELLTKPQKKVKKEDGNK